MTYDNDRLSNALDFIEAVQVEEVAQVVEAEAMQDWQQQLDTEWDNITTAHPELANERFAQVAGEVLNAGGTWSDAYYLYDQEPKPAPMPVTLDDAYADLKAEFRAAKSSR